jgi:hypothetical protein
VDVETRVGKAVGANRTAGDNKVALSGHDVTFRINQEHNS